MKGHRVFTDEDLNRYIDGEMSEQDKGRLQTLLARDHSLAARIRDYRTVDRAVREAFDSIEPPADRADNNRMRVRRRGFATASLLLAAGFIGGWLGHSLLNVSEVHQPLAGGINLPVQERQHLNTLFHIDLNDQKLMDGLLDRAEAVLTAYAGQDTRVEVVANAAGLNLLRADTSAVAPRVREMMDKYENLTFVACANTIKWLQEQGADVLLIDRTHASKTALDHVVERLRNGWTYIKI